jgi:hypothetical protein
MTSELRDKYYGQTVGEYMEALPRELPDDAVGLWQIEAAGSDWFGLSGDRLVDFVRQGIAALLAKGAKPVVQATDGVHDWIPVDYGETPRSIADAIIAEWQKSGRAPTVGDVWFAIPDLF